MNRLIIFTFSALLLGSWLTVSSMDMAHEMKMQNHYCEMVSTHKKTSGAEGWPAYKGEEQCH